MTDKVPHVLVLCAHCGERIFAEGYDPPKDDMFLMDWSNVAYSCGNCGQISHPEVRDKATGELVSRGSKVSRFDD